MKNFIFKHKDAIGCVIVLAMIVLSAIVCGR